MNITNSSSDSYTNLSNEQKRQQDLQQLLRRQYKGCFITTKPIKVGITPVKVGTAGKVIKSRHRPDQYCVVFSAPYYGLEAMLNPVTDAIFGVSIAL